MESLSGQSFIPSNLGHVDDEEMIPTDCLPSRCNWYFRSKDACSPEPKHALLGRNMSIALAREGMKKPEGKLQDSGQYMAFFYSNVNPEFCERKGNVTYHCITLGKVQRRGPPFTESPIIIMDVNGVPFVNDISRAVSADQMVPLSSF
ncbi:hypothetical protein TNCV_1481611 [Trichonephila clavipes]|nr:hypothetical protein TNCV_1481611 [Trichonephila clavipes]